VWSSVFQFHRPQTTGTGGSGRRDHIPHAARRPQNHRGDALLFIYLIGGLIWHFVHSGHHISHSQSTEKIQLCHETCTWPAPPDT
jgi:hypothetical protein